MKIPGPFHLVQSVGTVATVLRYIQSCVPLLYGRTTTLSIC